MLFVLLCVAVDFLRPKTNVEISWRDGLSTITIAAVDFSDCLLDLDFLLLQLHLIMPPPWLELFEQRLSLLRAQTKSGVNFLAFNKEIILSGYSELRREYVRIDAVSKLRLIVK